MAESRIPLGPISVFEEFVCEAIPGKSVAGRTPRDARPGCAKNGEIVAEDEAAPTHGACRSAGPAALRSRLDKLPTAEILTLVRNGGLTPEQLHSVREAVASRTAAHQSEIQQLNEILKSIPST